MDCVLTGLGAAEILAGSPSHRHQMLLDRFRRTGDKATAVSIKELLRREGRPLEVLPGLLVAAELEVT